MIARLALLTAIFLASTCLASDQRIIVGDGNPNLAEGARQMMAGHDEKGIELTLLGLRVANGKREEEIALSNLCAGYTNLGDYETAVKDARHAIRHPSASYLPHTILAPALALLDRREEAKIALDKLLEIKPDFSPDTPLAAWSPRDPEALRPLFKTLIDGLRQAGLPE